MLQADFAPIARARKKPCVSGCAIGYAHHTHAGIHFISKIQETIMEEYEDENENVMILKIYQTHMSSHALALREYNAAALIMGTASGDMEMETNFANE